MTINPSSYRYKNVEIRAFEIEKLVWFVAEDVALALLYPCFEELISLLEADEKETFRLRTADGERELITLNEAGLYHAILSCSKPEDRSFRRWMMGEVLPAIRSETQATKTAGEGGLPDPQWLAEGRKKLLAWSEAVTAGEKVKFPELDDQTVAGMMGFALRHSRFLVTIGDDGRIHASTIPTNACVMSVEQLLKAINEPNGVHVDAKTLLEFIHAATQRLAQKFDYYEARNRKSAT